MFPRTSSCPLIMTATGEHKLPSGNLPRLLIAWTTTEARANRRARGCYPRALSESMRKRGMVTAGGRIS